MALPAGKDPYSYGHMRSSRADRERTVELLKAAFTEGRLDHDELAERAGRAYASRTYLELAALTQDLPVWRWAASPLAGYAAGWPAGPPAASQADASPPASPLPAEQLPAEQLPAERLPAERLPAEHLPAEQPVLFRLPGGQPGLYRLPSPPPRVITPDPTHGQVSGLALASAILGVGGFLTLGITSPVALILGIAAVPRLMRRGATGTGCVFLGILLGLFGTFFVLIPELLMGRLLP